MKVNFFDFVSHATDLSAADLIIIDSSNHIIYSAQLLTEGEEGYEDVIFKNVIPIWGNYEDGRAETEPRFSGQYSFGGGDASSECTYVKRSGDAYVHHAEEPFIEAFRDFMSV